MTRPVRAIIKLGYTCNNNCLFCHSADLKHLPALNKTEALARIARAQEIGANSILFSGGEPTIRKDLVQLAEACWNRRIPFGLITNGRMLSYRPLLNRLLTLGLEYVYLSIHGPKTVHDALTQSPGSFDQTMTALGHLVHHRNVSLFVNAVVTAYNLDYLKEIVALVAPLPGVKVKFSLVEPKGSALQQKLLIPPQEAACRVSEAVDFGLSLGVSLDRFGVEGFPHCLDPRFPRLQDDLFTHGVFALREVDEDRFFPIDYANMTKPETCRGCLIGDGCRCTWTKVVERFGTDYLRPVRGGVPNSFNYFPLAPNDSGEGIEPERLLNVASGAEPKLYATDTCDFPLQKLTYIRDSIGQVYLQTDESPFVTDFPRQLRKLKRVDAGGEERAPLFKPMAEDLFAGSEAKLRRILAAVSGDVLDVGCGNMASWSFLGPVGHLVAVDPHPGSWPRKLAEAGEITLIESPIEAVELQHESFDWVLVLRSHNHLADLWTAYSRIVSALRWGGRLLVVDNVSFGLVRPSSLREAINAIPPKTNIEHLRDHDESAAASFLARFPLVEVERHPVGPDTANQWILLFKKLWPSGLVGSLPG